MNKVFLCALAVSLITISAVAGPVQAPSPDRIERFKCDHFP